MEDRTRFDVNEALRRWRDTLQRAEGLRTENIAELESHARDSIEDLRGKGLSAEEAVLIALRRVGPVNQLQAEFGKMDPGAVWLPRLLWMAFGVTAYLVAMDSTSVAAYAVALAGSQFSLGGYTLGWLALATRVLAVAVVVVAACTFVKFRGEHADAWVSRCVRHPVAAIVVLTAAVVGFRVLGDGLIPLLVRALVPSALGQFFMVYSWGVVVTFVVAPVVMVVFLMRLLSPRRAGLRGGTAALLSVLAVLSVTGCGQKASPTATGAEAAKTDRTPLEQAVAAWAGGKQDEAAEAFLKLDFSESPFSKGSALSYSETEFIALPAAAREKLSRQMIEELASIKALCRRIADLGKEARSRNDTARADQCARQLQKCGEQFSRPSSLLLLQQVGKALQKLAAEASKPQTTR